jgi:hypothetical protein
MNVNPWTVLGWISVVLVSIPVLIILGLIGLGVMSGIISSFKSYFRYLKTRNILPAAGQKWMQNGSTLKITNVSGTGVIGVKFGNASWSESPEDWKKRVRNRKLYLLHPPSTTK